MKNKMVSMTAAAIMLLSTAALGGCNSTPAVNTGTSGASNQSTSAIVDEKSDSGVITVYTCFEDELVTTYLADFKAKYPKITVNVVRESTGIITAKLLAEKDNPQADLIWGVAASSMMVCDNEDMLMGYSPVGVERLLPDFKSDKAVPTWVGLDVWETAIVVNTVEAAKLGLPAITSYQDLLKPEFKGHIVMSNPNSSGTGFLTVSAVLQLNGKETQKGWDYLTKLNENVSQYVHSGSKPAKMAAAGECAVGISFGYAGLSQKAKGSPVDVIFPTEGSGWDLEASALVKKKNIVPAARTFIDWSITDDAMKLYEVNNPIIATGGNGTYKGYTSNPVEQLIENDFSWAAKNRESILNKWIGLFDAKSAPKT